MSVTPEDLRDKLRAAIETLPKQVRYRALNALDGSAKAKALLDTDREMASFRALTAQEEAASAVFMALKHQKYPGAERLNVGNHRHKWAFWPVVDAARMSVARTFKASFKFTLTVSPANVRLSAPLSAISSDHPPEFNDHTILMEKSLDLHHSVNGNTHLFDSELAEIAAANGHIDIARHLATITNMRNRLLYATDSGTPASQATLGSIEARAKAVEIALFLAIALLQTPKLQAYALQALETLLILVAKADELEMPYPQHDPTGLELTLRHQDGSED